MFREYKSLLDKNEISPTTQRVMILEFLDKHRIHPTVEQVYNGLKDKMISLSKATVYNTLNKFVESGIVHELTIFSNEIRYEYDKVNHIHFKCIKCSKIYDIKQENSLHKETSIEEHKILDYQINLRGICKNCLSKENEE